MSIGHDRSALLLPPLQREKFDLLRCVSGVVQSPAAMKAFILIFLFTCTDSNQRVS